MCAAAIIWAGFEGVVYANNPDYKGKEVNWSFIKCRDVLKSGKYINDVALDYDKFVGGVHGSITEYLNVGDYMACN